MLLILFKLKVVKHSREGGAFTCLFKKCTRDKQEHKICIVSDGR